MRSYRLRVGPADIRFEVSRHRPRGDGGTDGGGVTLAPAPEVRPLPRDPQRALDHLRAAALAGNGRDTNEAVQAHLADLERRLAAAPDLASRVAATSWYHTIELPGGVVTPGNHDHRPLVAHLGLPDDLTGARALDVATFDGFWAFELERRGAEVVGIDLADVAQLDWPTGVRDIVVAEGLDVALGRGFEIAAEALGSSVKREMISVYDLHPDLVGTFDVVFVGDLLLHLERPLQALRAIRSVTDGTLVLVDRVDPELSGDGRRLLRYEGGWKGMEWWAPSVETLTQWVVDAGFADPDVRLTYTLAGHDKSHPGWQRALIHADGRIREPVGPGARR